VIAHCRDHWALKHKIFEGRFVDVAERIANCFASNLPRYLIGSCATYVGALLHMYPVLKLELPIEIVRRDLSYAMRIAAFVHNPQRVERGIGGAGPKIVDYSGTASSVDFSDETDRRGALARQISPKDPSKLLSESNERILLTPSGASSASGQSVTPRRSGIRRHRYRRCLLIFSPFI
jgi:hypothetical protein